MENNSKHTLEPNDTGNYNWKEPPIEPPKEFIFNRKSRYAVTIKTGEKWYTRIWYWITNPITYIFAGRIRF